MVFARNRAERCVYESKPWYSFTLMKLEFLKGKLEFLALIICFPFVELLPDAFVVLH